MRGDTPSGLYRWLLPGKDIAKVDAAKLRGETGQLILPGVTAFGVEAVVRSEQEKEYEGELPAGLHGHVTITSCVRMKPSVLSVYRIRMPASSRPESRCCRMYH